MLIVRLRVSVVVSFILALSSAFADDPVVESTEALVGRSREEFIMTPVNQRLTPYGRQVELSGLRPQAIALSPDGKQLVVSGKTSELIVINPETGEIGQRVRFPVDLQIEVAQDPASFNILKPDGLGQVSFTGLIFSPDGRQIYLSNVNGSIKVFTVGNDGQIVPSRVLPLPPANALRRKLEIPSGLAISEDGARLYVCGNLSNQLHEIDVKTGKTLQSFDVGAAPYDVVLVKGKAYVSNWAGRRPGPGDLTGPAGRGTEVRVDPIRHISSEGSVSIVTLNGSRRTEERIVGLHACALAASPDGKYLVCANAGSDQLSVIDTASDDVIETIWMKAKPSDLFGASPNALAFNETGTTLYVANGTQNAIGVVHFEPEERGDSRLIGLIPAGWFPGAVTFDVPRKMIHVANIKGLPQVPKKDRGGREGFNSHHYHGSVSMMPVPGDEDLARLSELAARNMRRGTIAQAMLPPRPDQAARAIPERIGEPSKIKHVVYVIKENRTYDQVFGGLPQGNGRADLCIFGEDVTPNQHKMVREFVLLDNTYCAGILSADGHQWSTTAFSTDYLEKSFAGFPRSYPDGMGIDESDAISYSPAGFLWDNALANKKTIRNYGEFMVPEVRWRDPQKKGTPDYLACYRTWKGDSDEVILRCAPAIESIRNISPPDYVGWEMAVPDQYRADFFLRELKEFEQKGEFPSLVIICLPQDHTSGTSPGTPTPASCMADNDLAFGRIVEGLSRSSFWKEMAIFGIEDDPQDGWDHVSGYRTTAYCISPYTKRGQVISTQYNTTSVLRTIEQILGLPVMNQFDASATPMFDCFTETPDFTPFQSVAINVPLDQMNPSPNAILDGVLKEDAIVSSRLNFREVDKAPEDVLNRILWRSRKGTQIPYPEWAVTPSSDDD